MGPLSTNSIFGEVSDRQNLYGERRPNRTSYMYELGLFF